MTSDTPVEFSPASRPLGAGAQASMLRIGIALAALGVSALPLAAAEASYPFEGTWVRANRACTPNAPLARTYTARDVTSATSHCNVRKIATGSGQFEIFEECRRAERPGDFTETIRMLGPDAMVVRRKAGRLKIARPLRYIRCGIAAPAAGVKPMAPPHRPAVSGEAPSHPPDAGAAPAAPAPKP